MHTQAVAGHDSFGTHPAAKNLEYADLGRRPRSNARGHNMLNTLRDTLLEDHTALCALFDAPLRRIARRVVRVWFNRDRLDEVLSQTGVESLPYDLIYAIDTDGRQISSNIHRDSIDRSAYGQDLSRRPYSVTSTVLNNAAFQGAFLCDVYISQVTRRPCVTIMRGVTWGTSTLGFIAADLDLEQLPTL